MFLGIDLGGTKCAINLSDDQGNLLSKQLFETGIHITFERLFKQIQANIQEILHSSGIEIDEVKAIGISCGGPLDSQKGIIMSPPNLPLLDDIHIVQVFQGYYGIPTYLENDANACAIAEHYFGAGKGIKHMIFLTFGTGLGAGLILNNKLYAGANGMAGEVGHIRLEKEGPEGYNKAGAFEGFCSGGGIVKLAQLIITEKTEDASLLDTILPVNDMGKMTTKKIAEAAKQGDLLAKEIIQVSATYLGKGIAMLIDIFNPERIVIGSIYARCEELFKEDMWKEIKKEALEVSYNRCDIVPAVLGESIGDYASIAVAMDGVTERLV